MVLVEGVVGRDPYAKMASVHVSNLQLVTPPLIVMQQLPNNAKLVLLDFYIVIQLTMMVQF